jgi:arginine/lysine/ornithine decarboxylase
MDQPEAPILGAVVDYRKAHQYGFTPPGDRHGRGIVDRVLSVLGREPFHDDLLASGGLPTRRW